MPARKKEKRTKLETVLFAYLKKLSIRLPWLKDSRNRAFFASLSSGIIGCFTMFLTIAFLRKVGGMDAGFATGIGLVFGLLVAIKITFSILTPRLYISFLIKQKYLLLSIFCCLLFFGAGAASIIGGWHYSKTEGMAITYDEVSILPNGYYYQQNGKYYVNPEHPPLVKFIAALPFRVLNPDLPKEELSKDVLLQDYAQYYWGKIFLFETNNETEALIFWARLSVLAANTFLLMIVFISLARIWDERKAFFATFLIAVSPFSIAHGSIVTIDFMAAVLSLLTMLWFAVLLKKFRKKQSTLRPAILTALFLCGALAAKLSAVLLIPIIILFSIFYALLIRKELKGRWRSYGVVILGMFTLALVLIVLFYSWHVRNMTTAEVVEQLRYNFSSDYLPEWIRPILESIAGWGSLGRGFVELCIGIIKINTRIAKGAGGVFFMGNYYGVEGAGFWYFPLVYITKLHIGYHLASMVALFVGLRAALRASRKDVIAWIAERPLVPLLVLYCFAFAGIAFTSTLQLGLRHIMPVVFGISVVAAYGFDYFLQSLNATAKRRAQIISIFVMVWMIGTVLITYPYYLSYYNVLGGGTTNGHKIATDSNYDWGQDLKRLAQWQQKNNVNEIYVDLFTNPFLPYRYYLGSGAQIYKINEGKKLPKGAYLAVSANQYQINKGKKLPKEQSYYQFDDNLVERVGTTIFVYKVQ